MSKMTATFGASTALATGVYAILALAYKKGALSLGAALLAAAGTGIGLFVLAALFAVGAATVTYYFTKGKSYFVAW